MAAPDGGWGWVVVFAGFVMYIILGGIERTYGVWYIEILDRYEASSALSEWLIGVHSALRLMCFPFITMLYARIPIRILGMFGAFVFALTLFISAFLESFLALFMVFGVIGGIFGSSLVQFIALMVIVEYFDSKKAIALGIVSSGSGFGGFLLSPVISYWFENFSYFETVTFIAGIALQGVVACALCFPVYEEASEETLCLLEHDPHKKSFSRKAPIDKRRMQVRKAQGNRLFEVDLLWNPLVLPFVLGAIATTMGGFPIAQLIVHYAVTKGETLETASLLITGTGLVEIVLRLAGGVVFNLKCLKYQILPIWNSFGVVFGTCAFLITLCNTYWEFQVLVALSSGCFCLVHGFSPVIFGRLFEESAFAGAFALFNNGIGLGILGGTYVAGYLKDISGSYEQSYYFMGALSLFSSLAFWVGYLMVMRAKRTRKHRVYLSLKR